MEKKTTGIIWLRKDFRTIKNDALIYASKNHEKVCVLYIYKKKEYKHLLIYLFLSIVYFTGVQSWYGGTRYFAPILIYLSFLFSFGVTFLMKNYKKN